MKRTMTVPWSTMQPPGGVGTGGVGLVGGVGSAGGVGASGRRAEHVAKEDVGGPVGVERAQVVGVGARAALAGALSRDQRDGVRLGVVPPGARRDLGG